MSNESKTQQIVALIKAGENDVKAITEKVVCTRALVYTARAAYFPKMVRKYKKKKKSKKLLTAQFSNNNSTVTFVPSGETLHDYIQQMEKQSEKFFEDTAVNHPAHYTAGGIETYDFIVAKKLSYELGNVVKYITRADYKGNKLQDLKKAQWYLNAAIKMEEQI